MDQILYEKVTEPVGTGVQADIYIMVLIVVTTHHVTHLTGWVKPASQRVPLPNGTRLN